MASVVVEEGLRSSAPTPAAGDSGTGSDSRWLRVRAQALKRDGTLVDDFQLVPSCKVLHVFNVPSPAATASLMMGKTIVDGAAGNLGLA